MSDWNPGFAAANWFKGQMGKNKASQDGAAEFSRMAEFHAGEAEKNRQHEINLARTQGSVYRANLRAAHGVGMAQNTPISEHTAGDTNVKFGSKPRGRVPVKKARGGKK